MKDYIWILGGSVHQIPVINEARALGLGIVCSDININCVAKDMVDIFINISIYDKEYHIKKIKDLKNQGIFVKGIVCIGVDAAITMGAVNDYFNFNGISEKIATICKDKAIFREMMNKWGLPNAKYIVLSQKERNLNISQIEFPIIVKPNNGFGSVGTKIFHNKNGIQMHIDDLLSNGFEKVIVEEFFIGEEQTVQAIIDYKGNFIPEFVTDRFFTRKNYPVEIGLQHPSSLDIDKQNELFNFAKKISQHLKIKSGTIKLDTIVCGNEIRVLEATVRVAGGFDPYYLVPNATGKNIMQNAILTALKKPLNKKALINKKNKFALTGSPFPNPGIIDSISGIEEVKKMRGVEEVFLFAKVGDKVKEPKDGTCRICFILVSDESLSEAKRILEKAIKKIEIRTE